MPLWFPHLIHILSLGCLWIWIARYLPLSGERIRRFREPAWVLVASGALWCYTFLSSHPPGLLSDYNKAYFPAGEALLDGRFDASLYAQGVQGFVNIPIMALPFAALAVLGEAGSGAVFSLVGAICALGAWAGLVRLARLGPRASLMLLLLFAANGPLHYSGKEGNTTHIVLGMLVGALLLLKQHRLFLAGIMLGFAALVKPPLLLFGLYFFAKRRWPVVSGGATALLATGVLSLWVFGWDLHVAWYRESIAPFSGNSIAAFNVQSLHAWILRWGAEFPALADWSPVPMSAFQSRLAFLAVAGTYGVTAFISWQGERRLRTAGRDHSLQLEAEYSMMILLAAITSPVSWIHYYAWLLIPMAFWLGNHPCFRPAGPLVPAAVLLFSLPVVLPTTATTPGFVRPLLPLLSSHYLYGALVLAGVLLAGIRAHALPRAETKTHGVGPAVQAQVG